VDSIWAAANAPNYYQKLRIDELWLGWGHASPAAPPVSYEAEKGRLRGTAVKVPCATCSGGAKVTGLGDVTINVQARGGLYLLTLVGPTVGTHAWSVSVNGWPAATTPVTGSGDTNLARSIPVLLFPGFNTVRVVNSTDPAPDLDKITVGPIWP